jgi:hypothetical protein
MIIAQVLSPWYFYGGQNKRPQFFDDYSQCKADDVTGQVSAPPPGVLVVRATMTPEQYAVLEADNRYNILTAQEVPEL